MTDSDDTQTSPPVASTDTPKKLPKGIILDKDGKPCRSCNSFASFTSATKKTKSQAAALTTARSECPPDVEALGRSTWTLLHTISATYPETPSAAEQSNLRTFFGSFARLYPCWVCAEDFAAYLEREKIRTESRKEFGEWLCGAHNEVNRKLGKKEFDCSRWEERWRTGWKDGRCD